MGTATPYGKPMFLFMALIGCSHGSVSSNPTTRQGECAKTSLDKRNSLLRSLNYSPTPYGHTKCPKGFILTRSFQYETDTYPFMWSLVETSLTSSVI